MTTVDTRGGHNRYSFNKEFFKSWSDNMAYVLGFLFADGNITDASISSRTQYVKFTNTDKDIIEKIREAIRSNHPLQLQKSRTIRYPDGAFHKNSPTFNLRIGSRELFADMLRLGVIPNKSLTVTFPHMPNKYLSHFVRGYFDGDGCVYAERTGGKNGKIFKRLRTIFTSGSEKYLIGLRDALLSVAEINNGHINYEHRAFRLVYGTNESREISSFIYKNKGELFLKRKYLIFKNYPASRQERGKTVKSN